MKPKPITDRMLADKLHKVYWGALAKHAVCHPNWLRVARAARRLLGRKGK